MEKYICIHAHFYQPQRENPYLDEVEIQESAHPYHDWNQRITDECYAPNAFLKLVYKDGTLRMMNNYSLISFDFGPTLLRWLERKATEVYEAILKADSKSKIKFNGHGSAIAHPYCHMIMPLASREDKITNIKWGIRDFEERFGRYPEGFWLPETAVDIETLTVLADEGIKFTILAPHQARRIKKIEGGEWIDVLGEKIETTQAYLCRLPGNRTINIFFYNREISHEVAFSDLLSSGENFAKRLFSAFKNVDKKQLVNIATDGETYGHHKKFAEQALAYALISIEKSKEYKLANYGMFLELSPPEYEVEIIENTSWSCIHGVERWRKDCGCGKKDDWSLEWRIHLRQAMDWLREETWEIYLNESAKYLENPIEARNNYIEVLLKRWSDASIESFFNKHSKIELNLEDKRKLLKLLEAQKNVILTFESGAWFFEDISRIEALQVISNAARAIELIREVASEDLEKGFIQILSKAKSNLPEFTDGGRIYELFVKPLSTDLNKVAANYAALLLLESRNLPDELYSYKIKGSYEKLEMKNSKLTLGELEIRSIMTLNETKVQFASSWLGDHELIIGVKKPSEKDILEKIKEYFRKENFQELKRIINENFKIYSVNFLFKDIRKLISDELLRVD